MKILFLLLNYPIPQKGMGMYYDIVQEFVYNRHECTVIASNENLPTTFTNEEKVTVLRVHTGQIRGVKNLIKKGINVFLQKYQFLKGYKKYLGKESFDWVIMPTPPVTLVDVYAEVKKHTNAKFYIILRDIHPQSIWSIGLLKNKLMYNYLKRKSEYAYAYANLIGCMSQGNIDFIKQIYPRANANQVVLLHNWMKSNNMAPRDNHIREKYGFKDKFVAIYGGSLGYGQRIENLARLAELVKEYDNVRILIIGNGVEKERLQKIKKDRQINNLIIMNSLPQEDYVKIANSMDLGLVCINENYSVPTCPSKVIAYMSQRIPVFAMINPNNDYGTMIENEAKCGYFCIGGDETDMKSKFIALYKDAELRKKMGENGYKFYIENMTPEKAYHQMMNQMEKVLV